MLQIYVIRSFRPDEPIEKFHIFNYGQLPIGEVLSMCVQWAFASHGEVGPQLRVIHLVRLNVHDTQNLSTDMSDVSYNVDVW